MKRIEPGASEFSDNDPARHQKWSKSVVFSSRRALNNYPLNHVFNFFPKSMARKTRIDPGDIVKPGLPGRHNFPHTWTRRTISARRDGQSQSQSKTVWCGLFKLAIRLWPAWMTNIVCESINKLILSLRSACCCYERVLLQSPVA